MENKVIEPIKELLPQDLLKKLLGDNNLIIRFTPLTTRPLQDGAIMVEMPSLVVEYGKK